MTTKLRCPKCKQTDKGFSRQSIVAETIDNNGKLVLSGNPFESNPEVLQDTARYFCLADGCEFDGDYIQVVVETA